jgi:hypothetical protein
MHANFFGGETAWKMVTWKTEKIGDNIKVCLNEIGCGDGR